MRLHHNDVILTTEISRDEELLLINVWDGRLGNFLNNHLQREGERERERERETDRQTDRQRVEGGSYN